MSITITQDLGPFTVTVEADRADHVIEQLAFWNDLPVSCPICRAPVRFYHRQPQSYDYYGLYCDGNPAHECNFGIRKEDHSLFYKHDSWRKMGQPDPQNQEPQYRQQQSNTRQDGPQASRSAPGDWETLDADDLPWDGPDGQPEPIAPDPFDWGDFLAQCRGSGVSGRHVRQVIGGPADQKIMEIKDILPWLKAQPGRTIATLVSQAATIKDAQAQKR